MLTAFRVAALAMCAFHATLAQSGDASVVKLLEPIRQAHKLPALGAALVTSQGIVASGVTGVRRKDATPEAKITDLWHLGSDTKAMTATVLATLVERHALTWNTTVGDVFKDLIPESAAAFRSITLTQLLSHHAGLPPNLDWAAIARQSPSLREQRLSAVKTAASGALLSAPGTKYEYSNLGYVIAGAMAERVSDSPWETLMEKIVFTPLGMSTCGFGGVGTPGQLDQPWPHGEDGKPMSMNGPAVDNREVMGPAGTVHCSIADWSKFIVEQLRGANGRGALLTTETYKVLHDPKFGGNYAFGWLVASRPWAGGTVLTHAGSNTMNYCVVWIAPARDFAVLAVTNQGGMEAQSGTDEAVAALIQMHVKR